MRGIAKIRGLLQLGLAGLLVFAMAPVHALGLGSMELESRINQRFSASIPVIVPEDIDATELSVKLASDRQFQRLGLKRTGVVTQLNFSALRREDGKMGIEVTSEKRITEPMLSFVLEVEQGKTRTLRKYTAMLEAPTR